MSGEDVKVWFMVVVVAAGFAVLNAAMIYDAARCAPESRDQLSCLGPRFPDTGSELWILISSPHHHWHKS